ncbi:hypothetical protein VTN96DRAFT_1192 [Rasamsonia emersonii]
MAGSCYRPYIQPSEPILAHISSSESKKFPLRRQRLIEAIYNNIMQGRIERLRNLSASKSTTSGTDCPTTASCNCKKQDNDQCMLTGWEEPDAAHI